MRYRETALHLASLNPAAADRFCDGVETALRLLAAHPEIGPKTGYSKASGVRFWPLARFPSYLILYRVERGTVVVLRLIHGRRDISAAGIGE